MAKVKWWPMVHPPELKEATEVDMRLDELRRGFNQPYEIGRFGDGLEGIIEELTEEK